MGQKTIPTAIYKSMEGLSAADRGRAIVAELGWIRAILPSVGPWGTTMAAGPTPGGLLAVIGLGIASLTTGDDCGCE